jgi:hypothetical protein
MKLNPQTTPAVQEILDWMDIYLGLNQNHELDMDDFYAGLNKFIPEAKNLIMKATMTSGGINLAAENIRLMQKIEELEKELEMALNDDRGVL